MTDKIFLLVMFFLIYGASAIFRFFWYFLVEDAVENEKKYLIQFVMSCIPALIFGLWIAYTSNSGIAGVIAVAIFSLLQYALIRVFAMERSKLELNAPADGLYTIVKLNIAVDMAMALYVLVSLALM